MVDDLTFTKVSGSNDTWLLSVNAKQQNTGQHLTSHSNIFNYTGIVSTAGVITFEANPNPNATTTANDTTWLAQYDVIQDGETLTFQHRTNAKCTVQAIKNGATDVDTWKLVAFIGAGVVFLLGAALCYNKCCADDDEEDSYQQVQSTA